MFKPIVPAAALALFVTPTLADEVQYAVTNFDKIATEAKVVVTVRQGKTFKVTAEGRERDLRDLKVRKRGDTLHISNDPHDINWGLIDLLRDGDWVNVSVTLPNVEDIRAVNASVVVYEGGTGDELRVTAARAADVTLRDVSYGEIDADVGTGANMSLAGKCGTFQVDARTGGQLRAGNLVCDHIMADGSTGSDVALHGTKTASLKATTGASIKLAGGADILKSHHSTGGHIRN